MPVVAGEELRERGLKAVLGVGAHRARARLRARRAPARPGDREPGAGVPRGRDLAQAGREDGAPRGEARARQPVPAPRARRVRARARAAAGLRRGALDQLPRPLAEEAALAPPADPGAARWRWRRARSRPARSCTCRPTTRATATGSPRSWPGRARSRTCTRRRPGSASGRRGARPPTRPSGGPKVARWRTSTIVGPLEGAPRPYPRRAARRVRERGHPRLPRGAGRAVAVRPPRARLRGDGESAGRAAQRARARAGARARSRSSRSTARPTARASSCSRPATARRSKR